jgi:hypothetical protein
MSEYKDTEIPRELIYKFLSLSERINKISKLSKSERNIVKMEQKAQKL